MNKTSNAVRIICEVGIFAAIGYVLDELQSILSKGIFIYGGSIGFAMIAVLIIAYRRGWLPAILTGLIMGGLDLATSATIIHPAQLLLDYILPYAVVGLVGLLKPLFDKTSEKKSKILWLIAGTILGGLLKLLSHYLAGIFFWADPNNFAWGLSWMNPYLYCFIYNSAFIGPSIVLTACLLVAVYVKAPRVLQNVSEPREVETIDSKKDLFPIISSIVYAIGGSFTFVYFLIKYIFSFEDYTDGSAYGYDFNPDSMLIFVLAFMLLVLGVNAFIAIMRNNYSDKITGRVLVVILSCSLIYDIARLIKMYRKEKDPTEYWIWFGIGLFTLLLAITIYVVRRLRMKKMGA